jgi:CO/xanthine dehydrogenase Mo-binding subunit
MGEAGIVGMGAAIASAVADALGRPDAVAALPLTPVRVVDLIARGDDG